ncbi:unnamed protein product [Caenorhabditis brenneri]
MDSCNESTIAIQQNLKTAAEGDVKEYIVQVVTSLFVLNPRDQTTPGVEPTASVSYLTDFINEADKSALVDRVIAREQEDQPAGAGSGGEESVPAAFRVHDGLFVAHRGQAMIFVKQSNIIEADKKIASQVSAFQLNGSSAWEQLHFVMSRVLSPYCKYFISQSGRGERDGDKLASTVQKCFTKAEAALLNLQQNIEIPEINLVIKQNILDAIEKARKENRRAKIEDLGDIVEDTNFLNALQAGCNRWVKEIHKVTQLKRDPSSETSLQEMTFWLNLERALLLPIEINELQFAEVTAQVLNAVSEISVIGGAEIVKNLKMLFDKLTHMINDSSNLHKREAALRAIGGICRSTAYVVDPYRDYPTLLDDLLRILKTVMSNTMRRECINTLGILGAIDPYTHKVFTGSVLSSTAISTALSLPITETDSKDPRQDIIHWFNYEKCTLEEFYPAITIANLMLMMQDEDSQSYAEIAQAIVTIFRNLATASNNRASLREFFLQQLSIFGAIIKKHAAPYMHAIFTIIADAWKEDISVKMVVIQVLTEMGTAIGNDFSKYTGELIPYLLTVLQTDKTKEKILTVKVMGSIQALTHCIVQHLHLVLPPLLIILDDVSLRLCIRETALDTVLHMTQQVDVSAEELIRNSDNLTDKYVHYEKYRNLAQRAQTSRDTLNQSVFDGSRANLEAAQAAIQGQYFGKKDLHERLLNGSMDSNQSGQRDRFDDVYGIDKDKIPGKLPRLTPTSARPTSELITVQTSKQRLNKELLVSQWKNENLTSKDEWLQWLMKIRIGFLKSGSSPSLRAASSLGDQHPHLARDLFPAAFMSVWTELDSETQKDLTSCLLRAIFTGIPELIQTILNLAEFMDHSEKGPLPITNNVLGMWAEQTKAFAKACRYKVFCVKCSEAAPMTFRRKIKLEPNDCQSLITYANKLNVQEEAAGVVRYAERNEMNFQMRGRWYEKLNEWEKALDAYELEEKQQKVSAPNLQQLNNEDESSLSTAKAVANEEARMHEMRCLEALARWDELNSKSAIWAEQRTKRSDTIRDEINKKQLDHKMAVIAARGAWAVDNWERMAEYVSVISENTQDGAMLRAIVAVHK